MLSLEQACRFGHCSEVERMRIVLHVTPQERRNDAPAEYPIIVSWQRHSYREWKSGPTSAGDKHANRMGGSKALNARWKSTWVEP